MTTETILFKKGNPFLEIAGVGILSREDNAILIDGTFYRYDRYLVSVSVGKILSANEYEQHIDYISLLADFIAMNIKKRKAAKKAALTK